ncbi:copper resistance protein B [Candidatus Nitrospira allomarina]|uniref:Copper resistance protein B n=1 Tax=Candidatus Nitrospira allomarina TaxID=3020900 RepID=A0AA96GA91_9BACT|nr:copper resistance protein B [Candidatus Nitrospira allomarina]WNM57602.1 copper resistance protein B [Candidatus Nitrospira allomarina]
MRISVRCLLSLTVISLLIWDFHSSGIFAQSIPDESTSAHEHTYHPHTIQPDGQTDTRSGVLREMSATGSPESKEVDWPSPVMDEQRHGFFLADVLEYRPNIGGDGSNDDYRWDIEGWYGGDYNRIWFKSEGQRDTAFKANYDIDSQLLFGRFIQQYYDLQVGGRVETQSYRGRNVTRGLAVIGLQGLVPYNYEIQPAFFISQHGDLSARLTATKDLSLTQRLILQPRFETNAAIQRVRKFTTGSGLNNLELGFRLRYEIRREFAPYVGISLDKSFGDTASLVRQEGGNPSQIRFVVGVRLWF